MVNERFVSLGNLLALIGLIDLLVSEEFDEILRDVLIVGKSNFLVEKVAL